MSTCVGTRVLERTSSQIFLCANNKLVFQKIYRAPLKYFIAFVCEAKRVRIASFLFFCRTFSEYRGIRSKKKKKITDHQKANTI